MSLILILLFSLSCKSFADIRRDIFPLERNGIKLHLERFSSALSSDYEALLFIHGVTYSSHEFDVNYGDYSLARFFANNGFNVWLLDIAGFGKSQEVKDGFMPDTDYAAKDIAAAVKFILSKSNHEKINILGWSWGTVTSGRFAAKNPELVKSLVLYAPIVAGLGEVKVENDFNKNTWIHAAGDFQINDDKNINYGIAEPEVVNTFLSNCWRYDKDKSPNGGRRDLLVSPSKRLIPTSKLNMPVLIIAGSKDDYVSPELCQEAFNTLPNKFSKIEIIEGASHIMFLEKPYYKIFRNAVLEFLNEQIK